MDTAAAHFVRGSHHVAASILHYTQFASPIVLLFVFLGVFTAHSILSSETEPTSIVPPTVTGPGGKPLPRALRKANKDKLKQKDFSPLEKQLFIGLSAALLATFIASGANVVVHAITEVDAEGWWCGEAAAVYIVASAFLNVLFLISLIDSTPSPALVHLVTWSLALAGELLLFAASALIYTSTHHPSNSLREEPLVDSATKWEALELAVDAVRVLLLTFLVGFYAIFRVQRSLKNKRISRNAPDSPTETTPLLNGDRDVDSERAVNGNDVHSSTNGTSPSEQGLNGHSNGICLGSQTGPAEGAAFYRPTTAPSRSWWEYLKSFALFFPYLWPSNSTRLKVVFVVCFVLLLAQRVVNWLVPIQLGKVTNELSDQSGQMPWWSISLLVVYKLLQGSSGLINAVRAVLWIPISQYSYQALTTASFEHVHSLSLDFHLGKRTGEVISALSKGDSINKFLEQITFKVAPMIIDLGVAITYFYVAFDSYYALVVSLVSFWYLYLTIRMAQWRAEQRREQTNADREEDAVKNDSIMSYETVKYFNAERYEYDRYRVAVKTYQEAEAKVLFSLSVMNITQNAVFMVGLLVTSFISAWQVTKGIRTVGDFVTLLTYMQQLQQPLNFFGEYYRTVQNSMISGERLLELFKEQPTVIDEDDAKVLASCEGQIRFDNVRFSYDQRRTALQSLSFTCEPGTTTALVGESGGGKSTIFRLLFRFYNPQEGSIQVDGHDVRDVSIDSVRKHIGVVPQDTVLFNETLMYNLKYANQNATDEEVYNACRAASIHDKIMAFPDGYNTKVGERGLRLSGGEKQRVAIARTIIKNPRIIMLDEATAALDTETEQHIQDALTTLSNGRTMLVIAHRLSTITSADQILVLHNGGVAESGTHHELLAKKGRYASMWRKQIRAERAAEAAALRKEALARPSSSAGDGINSEEVSESEAEGSLNGHRTHSQANLANQAMHRASERVRGTNWLLRANSEEGREERLAADHL